MLKRYFLVAFSIALACCAAYGQSPSKTNPTRQTARYISIPSGEAIMKRPAVGKIKLLAQLPASVKPATVCFYLDNTETGRVDRRPYAIELDTTRVADGEHSVKWSALDASGNEISKGSIFLVVTNKMRLDPEKIGSSAGPIPGIDDESDSSGQTADKTASGVEVVTYSNSDYDISLKHPIEWSVKDQTAALPDDWNKGYWLVISTDPVADAGHVVNIRHRLMQQEHTAESFIKFTPYVADWEQVSVKGRIVFVTTSGSPAAKRVMHRLMMLDGRHLWMMNCIDTTGEPAEKSKALFLQISESIEPEASPESGPIEAEQ